jgi:hypothetical protein
MPSDHHIAIVCNPQAGNGKALSIADRIIILSETKSNPLLNFYGPVAASME